LLLRGKHIAAAGSVSLRRSSAYPPPPSLEQSKPVGRLLWLLLIRCATIRVRTTDAWLLLLGCCCCGC
jgi:hypothetical protein